MIGTKLAHYAITAHLGSGGMGDVYQATDLKLKRSVAIKMLPAEFSSDAERLSRFRREAQLLASLNHPNVAHIYGLEESGDKRCIVMELVEGETLQSRLKRGPIQVDEALTIATQICEALEAAHEKGVIHRDLKPGNVMLTGDGKVKVLDFGLAKAMEPDTSEGNLSNSPTMMSMAGSMPGVILGTAAYMSPEQAKGRKVDKRSDIFAFGCVLYEMLTGTRAFDGDDVTDILGAVLRVEPDWAQLPADVPLPIRKLLRLCLEKNAKNRRSDASDVRIDIEQALKDGPGGPQERVEFVASPLWKRAIPIVLGMIIVAAIAAFAAWTLKSSAPPSTPVARFAFTLPEGQQFTSTIQKLISIAPDGSQFVYVANNRLYLKPMAEMSSLFIQGTEIAEGVLNPVFSPDSRSIAFYSNADKTVKRIAVSGGAAVTICPADPPFGMSWGADNNILIGQASKGIVRVSASGGKPETIVAVKETELAHGPQILPGGDAVLFTLGSTASGLDRWNKAQIVIQSLKSGERKVLIEAGSDATYLPTGHLLYALSGNLLTVPFDLQRLAVTGGPVPVIESIQTSSNGGLSGTSQFSGSGNGSLIFIPGGARNESQELTWFDRTGKTLETAGEPGHFAGFNLSPDSKRIAVHRHEGAGGDVWVYDASRPTPMRLTFDPSQENGMPVWSPDGKRIVFQSLRNGKWGLYQKNSDGTGAEELLIESKLQKFPMAWAPDGQSIAYGVVDPKTAADIWLLPLTGDRKAIPLLDSKFVELFPQISPDGKWLAYMSLESGAAQVYVKPFPRGDGKWQVSAGTLGNFPRWRGDGKELFYLTGNGQGKVMSVDVNGFGSNFVVGTPKELFEPAGAYGVTPVGHQGNYFVWAVSSDGQRFLMPQPVSVAKGSAPAAPTINVILNWTSLLKK